MLKSPWTEGDDEGFTIYLYETQLSPYLSIPESLSQRALPLSYPLQIEGEIVVNLRDSNWSFTDETTKEDNPFFELVYQVAYNKKLHQLTLSYDYRTKVDRVEVEQLADYIAALKKVDSIDSYGIVDYPKATSAAATSEPIVADTLESVNRWVLLGTLMLLSIVYALVSLTMEAKSSHQSQFYPVSLVKFFILSVFSLGLYSAYWSYKNWQYIKYEKDRPDIWPVARAIFSPLWYYPLYLWLVVDRDQRESQPFLIPAWTAVFLFVGYLGYNSMSWESDWGNWDYLIPFIVFAPLVMYVNKINKLNTEAYLANSQWHARNWVFMVCMSPLLLYSAGQDVGLIAQDDIITGEELWSHDIDFMQQNKVFTENEMPVLFYSDDWLSNRSDGNGFTPETVFSYWVENDELQVASSPLSAVEDIEVDYANASEEAEVAEVTIHVEDGDEFVLYATTTDEKDKVFVKQLMQQWQSQREGNTAL